MDKKFDFKCLECVMIPFGSFVTAALLTRNKWVKTLLIQNTESRGLEFVHMEEEHCSIKTI
jgi:hypothetical protein